MVVLAFLISHEENCLLDLFEDLNKMWISIPFGAVIFELKCVTYWPDIWITIIVFIVCFCHLLSLFFALRFYLTAMVCLFDVNFFLTWRMLKYWVLHDISLIATCGGKPSGAWLRKRKQSISVKSLMPLPLFSSVALLLYTLYEILYVTMTPFKQVTLKKIIPYFNLWSPASFNVIGY